jgi:hypothetical protein
VNIPSEAGDIVFWSMRTSHSGNNIRPKWLPNLCLPPRVETRLPRFLQIDEAAERFAAFCSMGAPGAHTDRLIEYQISREDCRDYWMHSYRSPEIEELARARGVELRTPIAAYGSRHAAQVSAQQDASRP